MASNETLFERLVAGSREAAEEFLRVLLQDRSIEVVSGPRLETIASMPPDPDLGVYLQMIISKSGGEQAIVGLQLACPYLPMLPLYVLSALDSALSAAETDLDPLIEVYAIMVCADYPSAKAYSVFKMRAENGMLLDDGTSIVMVNGLYVSDDEMGRLMQDFRDSEKAIRARAAIMAASGE